MLWVSFCYLLCNYYYYFYKRRLHAVYKITKDVCHNLSHAQTALIHYTRGPAEWLTPKPNTGMLTHLLLGDSGTRLQDTPCPGHRCFEDFTSHQLGLSRPTPSMSGCRVRMMLVIYLPARFASFTSFWLNPDLLSLSYFLYVFPISSGSLWS